MKTTLAKTMLSAWSCVGLVATFQGENLTIFDPNLSFCDPNYRVCLEFDVAEYGQVRQVLWNSVGSHLLVATEGNFILLYSQETGLVNCWKRVQVFQLTESIVNVIWCENRCKFGWNGQAVIGSNEPPIVSRMFRVEFVPPGRLGVLVLRQDGVVEGFIEELNSVAIMFKRAEIKLALRAGKHSILSQCASGSILAAIEDEVANSLQYFKLTSLDETAECLGQLQLPATPSKLIYHDTRSELIVYLMIGGGDDKSEKSSEICLLKFNLLDQGKLAQERTVRLQFVPHSIVHSPRAAGVFVTSASDNHLALLNDNGDVLKTFMLSSGEHCRGGLLLSPNGLCLGQVSFFSSTTFPVLVHQPVAELNPRNITAIRELIAKLITSTLNGSDVWDILHVLSISVQKSTQTDAFGLLSTLLSEWTGYIELAGMKSEDFYGLLLELFKLLSKDQIYWRAYEVVDAVIQATSTGSIISICEEDSSFETNVSVVPVIERSTLRLAAQLKRLTLSSSTDELEIACLLLLNEEFNRASQQLIKAAQSLHARLADYPSSNPSVSAFLTRARDSIGSALASLPGANADTFCTFLSALLSDPQLHSKCTKNVFGFLTDVVLDDASTSRKLSAHVYRIYTRYFPSSDTSAEPNDANNSDGSSGKLTEKEAALVDSVSGLKLPPGRCMNRLLQCRRCNRLTLTSRKSNKAALLRSEQIFAADWQNSLWRHRCQCGSLRRKIKI